MSSTDTNGGHQVIRHLGIVQLWVSSELTNVIEYPYVITWVSNITPRDSYETQASPSRQGDMPRVKS